jgi:hypothetical protein
VTRQLQLPDARFPAMVQGGPVDCGTSTYQYSMEILKWGNSRTTWPTTQLEDDIWDCLEMGCLPPRSGLFNRTDDDKSIGIRSTPVPSGTLFPTKPKF